LSAALNAPVFTPYMGRKPCPLSAPMAAKVVAAEGAEQALLQVTLPPFLRALTPVRVISDVPLESAVEEMFWDEPLDREAWNFGQRRAFVRGQGQVGEGSKLASISRG
jgi:CRISPR system Cascade subunit CasD